MLYYVDLCSELLVKEFVPHIPANRMIGENGTIKRICLSETLEGCFSASPELESLV